MRNGACLLTKGWSCRARNIAAAAVTAERACAACLDDSMTTKPVRPYEFK